jgi:hypothetical protein|tara:strand:- start:1017 stop:1406 length:390 start_codon:yes stop_codon:yes gene_type:complete
MNYSNIVSTKIIIDTSNNVSNLKPGWTYIDKKTKKIYNDTKYSNSNKLLNDEHHLSYSQIINIYNNLSNHWNSYRDQHIELYGDLSQYYHYKSKLTEMINEEEYIYNKINNTNYKNDDDTSNYSADELY